MNKIQISQIALAIILIIFTLVQYFGFSNEPLFISLLLINGILTSKRGEFISFSIYFIIFAVIECKNSFNTSFFFYTLSDYSTLYILPFITGAWLRAIFYKNILFLWLLTTWVVGLILATIFLIPFRSQISNYPILPYIASFISYFFAGIFIKKFLTQSLIKYTLYIIPYIITIICIYYTSSNPLDLILAISIGIFSSTISFLITKPKF